MGIARSTYKHMVAKLPCTAPAELPEGVSENDRTQQTALAFKHLLHLIKSISC